MALQIFAIAVFAFIGIFPIFTPDMEPIPVSDLLFALYITAFVEEFFFRAIIQGKLERALGQNKAWFYSGILFGLAHVTTNSFVRVACHSHVTPGLQQAAAAESFDKLLNKSSSKLVAKP